MQAAEWVGGPGALGDSKGQGVPVDGWGTGLGVCDAAQSPLYTVVLLYRESISIFAMFAVK